MKTRIHSIAGLLAVVIIATFWLGTVGVELFGAEEHIRIVKLMIPWGLLILVPSLALAGGVGNLLGRGRTGRLVASKRKRMPFVAANGVVILIPAALFLAWKADTYAFDAAFYAVQAAELVAGAVNLALLGMNVRDGFRLTGRWSG